MLGALLAIAVPAQAADKPNVILIITDDMGWGDPGSYGFDRGIKAPVLSFVSSEEVWLVMAIRQEGSQFVRPGQELEFALTMYPGEIFTTTVGALVHGAGEAQLSLGGQIPPVSAIREIGYFAVRANLDETLLGRPMIFGASGLAAINTGEGADVFWLLRRIEIQSESLLNYLYNPFRG